MANASIKAAFERMWQHIVTALETNLEKKQNTLVSGENIKTINGESVLGSGDIAIEVDDAMSYTSENPVQNKVVAEAIRNLDVSIDELSDNVAYINGVDNDNIETEEVYAIVTNIDPALSDVSTNPVQNKVVANKINYLTDAIEDVATLLSTPSVDNNSFHLGYILADGTEYISYTRIVSDFIHVYPNYKIISDEHDFVIAVYDTNKNYINQHGWITSYSVADECYIRIVTRKDSGNSTIDESDIGNIAESFTLINIGDINYRFPTTENHYLKELYLSGVDKSKTVIIGQVAKQCAASADSTYSGIYFAYSDAPTNWIAAAYKYETAQDPDIIFDSGKILKVEQLYNSGVEGYVVFDSDMLDSGTRIYPRTPLNIDVITNIQNSPIIYNHTNSANVNDLGFRFPTTENNGLKELYLSGVDESREIIIGQIAKQYAANADSTLWYSGIYFAYSDAPTTWVAAAYKYETVAEPAVLFGGKKVLQVEQLYDGGVEGYVVFDFDTLENGTRVYPRTPLNIEAITNIQNSPIIYSYVSSEDIIGLNKEKEPYIMNQGKTRAALFGDAKSPLQFVHFSDIHGRFTEWDRIATYIDSYSDYIKFAIHTGDYCTNAQDSWEDLYAHRDNGKIYNCVGNHDYITDTTTNNIADASDTFSKLFATSGNWDVTFPAGSNLMYYYKDFANCGIRLIVIDQYYWDEAESAWLESVLSDARTNNLAVVTASHTQSGTFSNMVDCSFNTLDNYYDVGQPEIIVTEFEPLIVDFVNDGGTHIVHLCGHWHHDMTGYSTAGILNSVIECSTRFGEPWKNTTRIAGTKTQDCFNVVGIDSANNILKIVRIGNNTDGYMQNKNVLCYDYAEKKVIANS